MKKILFFLLLIPGLAFAQSGEIYTSGRTDLIVQDEGTTIAEAPYMNFTGSGVTATTSGGKMIVAISSGTGSITTVGDCAGPSCLVSGGNITVDSVTVDTIATDGSAVTIADDLIINGTTTLGGDFTSAGHNMRLTYGTEPVAGDCDNALEAGRVFIDIDAASSNQFYVCEGAAGWILSGGSGVTLINDLGDADGAGTVALAGNQQTWTSTLNSAGALFTLTNITADLTADVSFMDFKYTDDGDANGYFLRGYDNLSDLKWYIGAGGAASFDTVTANSFVANATAAPEVYANDSDDLESPAIKASRILTNLTTVTADAQVGDVTFYAPIAGSDVAFITRDGSGPTTTIANLAATGAVLTTSTATTPDANDNDTSIATTAFVQGEVMDYYQLTLLPQGAVLDDAAPPAISVAESTGTGTGRFYTAAFDAAADEIVYWTLAVPDDYNAAGTAYLDVNWYTNDVGADEDAIWAAQVSCTTEGDADDMLEQVVDTYNSTAENCNATEATRLIQTTITLTNIDSMAAGDACTIRFYRDADDSDGNADNDGLSSDAVLVSARLRLPRT